MIPDDRSERLAALHAQAFETPWDAPGFRALLDQSGVFALETSGRGFVLCRVVVDEAEILTLAVAPDARRSGVATGLIEQAVVAASAAGAERLFLEVAEDNTPALALYRAVGFVQSGRRKAYYTRRDGPSVDALLLTLNLAARLPTA